MHTYLLQLRISWGNKVDFSFNANMLGSCSDSNILHIIVRNCKPYICYDGIALNMYNCKNNNDTMYVHGLFVSTNTLLTIFYNSLMLDCISWYEYMSVILMRKHNVTDMLRINWR